MKPILWESATKSDQIEDFFVAYKAMVNGAKWLIAVNDFPAEILYTLIVDGKGMEDFNEWPKDWVRPETGRTDKLQFQQYLRQPE